MTDIVLVADIGGTNARFAFSHASAVDTTSARAYENKNFASLEDVAQRFLNEHGNPRVSAACVAVAGPVVEQKIALTNLDWRSDATTFGQSLGGAKVAVLNDLSAVGWAVPKMDDGSLETIAQPSTRVSGARTDLVVGIGTGFNAIAVHEAKDGHIDVLPSEAGHIHLPLITELAPLLAADYLPDLPGLFIEDILSGRGLEALYDWKRGQSGGGAALSGRELTEGNFDDKDTLAQETLRLFCQTLGAVIADLVKLHQVNGTVYLTGSVARAVGRIDVLRQLVHHWHAGPARVHVKETLGLAIICDDFAALSGCAAYLAKMRV